MKHPFLRRAAALALTGALMAGTILPAVAAVPGKEEVIYANLTASGEVTGIYAVSSFAVTAGQTVTDHGQYTAVRNMTTTDPINWQGDTVTVTAAEDGTLYYEGTMDPDTALPWNISVEYTLDGQPIRPEELGGRSGALELCLSIRKNPDCAGDFFDRYAMQVTMTLDTAVAQNICAEGATIANIGTKKQLTYILFPGQESCLLVTADVTDFAMPAISLNGVRLSLDLELDGENLTDLMARLQGGAVQLDEGANALADGIAQVQQGLDTLNGNSAALTGGSAQVRAALAQMQTALNGVASSTEELDALLNGSAQIREGLARLDAGAAELEQQVSFDAYKAILKENGLDLDVVRAGNEEAISALQKVVKFLPGFLRTQLENIILLLRGSSANIDAMQTYLDTVNGGIAQLHAGSSELNAGYAEFDAGVHQLAQVLTGMLGDLALLTDGVNALAAEYARLDDGLGAYTDGVAQLQSGVRQLAAGAAQLTAGTGELRTSTGDLDLGEQMNALLESLTADGAAQSFLSEENGTVQSLQFALQTAAIEPPAPAAAPEPVPVVLTFWQKLLKLFGLYKG